MYLKSLVLRGFKSFADRSALSLQPGITAIVGPNGSGKSNISDAVLWVLGERSARNLRGQDMQDIIFSGSAARKAVSMAEVDLILDNSDGTLPVEFDEVAITRRVYRSGESEYLVNGVVARRLDVLEILHDTGLGTGTHSIISQGSLDSILQSKPEDRRALIEEAAGVLKHKQRKEKSAKKLASMDVNLNRVRDVTGEIARQLKPLERKAKRAQAYQEARAELADIVLALAVDDLRTLQEQWDSVLAVERELGDEVAEKREFVGAAEQKVNDFQELMRRESQDAGEIARQQRRAATAAERIDSAEMLLRERRRAAQSAEADLQAVLDGADARRAEALEGLEAARQQLGGVADETEKTALQEKRIAEEKAAADARLSQAAEEVAQISSDMRTCEEDVARAQKELAELRETLSNGIAHAKLAQARKSELAGDLERATKEHARALDARKAADERLSELEARSHVAEGLLVGCFERREATREAHDKAREALRVAQSEASAVVSALQALRDDAPALAWLYDNKETFGGSIVAVSGSIKARGCEEGFVEALLGEDIRALAVEDAQVAQSIANALKTGSMQGDVSLIMLEGPHAKADKARACPIGHALVDDLEVPEGMAAAIDALLGDVVLCSSLAECFDAHGDDELGLRFASPDGCVVWPSGKVRIYGQSHDGDEGLLARERRLEELEALAEELESKVRLAGEEASKAEDDYRKAQENSLKLSQQIAEQKGACAAAESEEDRLSRRLSALAKEMEDIDGQVQIANKDVAEVRPNVERLEGRITDLEKKRAVLTQQRDEKAEQEAPLREEAARLSDELAAARLSAATLAERKAYAERIVRDRERDIASLDSQVAEARLSQVTKAVAIRRVEALLTTYSKLAAGMARKARLLDEAASAAESSSTSVHADAAAAREKARRAHDEFDEATARMTKAQVEKGRLEVLVQGAADAIVKGCGVPLEIAEQQPHLENRAQAEEDRARLERRIRSMGTINPDAAEQYAELKQRYDFLASQMADIEAARRALNRITRVIDARMKEDFSRTFSQVNANFGEIFELLFPGGSAHLSLTDPDDIEHAGVEVNAQPRGKRLTKMMLMSGGEKSLTALALLFAVYKTRATPFYILDEVEAALDDTNLRRLISYIDTLRATTQLIMITHQRRTMEMADVLFGVSMQADGVTKVISQKLERALEQAD